MSTPIVEQATGKAVSAPQEHAIAKRDGAYMQKIEADDYIFTGPDGKALTKAEDIKSNTAGDVVFDDFKIDPDKLRAIGRMGGAAYARTRDRFEMVRPKV